LDNYAVLYAATCGVAVARRAVDVLSFWCRKEKIKESASFFLGCRAGVKLTTYRVAVARSAVDVLSFRQERKNQRKCFLLF